MSVTELGGVQVPPGVAVWIDRAVYLFLGLFVLWVVLKAVGFAMRRAYNLTPVATAKSKDVRPDFLKVDHAAQKEMLERGREFDRQQARGLETATSAAGFGMVASGFVTFVSAAFLAFGRVEDLDSTWRTISAKDKLTAIVQSHPMGFAIAFAMVVAAGWRYVASLRKAR